MSRPEGPVALTVALTGGSGLVGRALSQALREQGARVVHWVRRPTSEADERTWDPAAEQLEPSLLDGIDAVVHLAGESIAGGRWSAVRKERILNSRVHTTRVLAEAMAARQQHRGDAAVQASQTLLVASAVGFYGDRCDQQLVESDQPGEGFLSHVCQRWEEAATAAREAGVRVLHTRLGMILSPQGGALDRMLTPFSWGLGGRLGSGRQFMSWVHLRDAVAAMLFLLESSEQRGIYNLVAPLPCRNKEFTATLGRVLGRPTLLPVPSMVLRLALGEMADELLLASTRALPQRLLEAGFEFRFGDLEGALKAVVRQ